MNTTFYVCLLIACVFFSAFFSGSEIVFNSLNKIRLKKSEESRRPMARLAVHISDRFTSVLSAILIGNNLVNIAASSTATLLVSAMLAKTALGGNETWTAVISTAGMTLIILVFGETLPKVLGRTYADSLVYVISLPVFIIYILLFPLVFLVMLLVNGLRRLWGKDGQDEPSINADELSTIIDTVEEEGVIDEDKSELLQFTLEFQDTTAEEVMTPRIDLTQIDIDDNMSAIRQTLMTSRYSRIPVYRDSVDHIIGILVLTQYYKKHCSILETASSGAERSNSGKASIESMLLPPQFVYKTTKLPAILNIMRESKVHMVIVTDEYGGTMGVVTMEDILEELVGEIWDEEDVVVPMIVKTGDRLYEVSGDMNIDDFFYEIDFDISERDFTSEYSTVGGWAVEMLNDAPLVGDSFTYETLCVIVTEMDKKRVTKVTVLVGDDQKDDD